MCVGKVTKVLFNQTGSQFLFLFMACSSGVVPSTESEVVNLAATHQDVFEQPLVLSLPGTAWNLQRPITNVSISLPLPASTTAVVQSSSFSRMPLFPYITETEWWPEMIKGQHPRPVKQWEELCRPIHQHYVHKDRRATLIAYMRFVRLAPLALTWLEEFALERKKKR